MRIFEPERRDPKDCAAAVKFQIGKAATNDIR
jgi:hypothetical protein